MRRILYLSALLISICFILNGCNNNNCPLTTVAMAHFDFLSSQTRQPVTPTSDITVTGFTIADVTVKDTLADGSIVDKIVKDSLLNDTVYNNPTTSMTLPLSFNSSTTYVIHYTELMTDTIVVEHTNIPYVESIDCGTMMFYKVNSIKYTTNNLDSIAVVNKDINNEEKRNFIIYYTTD